MQSIGNVKIFSGTCQNATKDTFWLVAATKGSSFRGNLIRGTLKMPLKVVSLVTLVKMPVKVVSLGAFWLEAFSKCH